VSLRGVRVGFAVTGSHCTLERSIPAAGRLREAGADVTPIINESVAGVATRFGEPGQWRRLLEEVTGHQALQGICQVEPIGPRGLLDLLVIAPCTGNTTAKLAHGIVDSTVLMAAKAQLRNQRPVLLAVSTNDGLGLNLRNIGVLLSTKNVFFVPFGQDAPKQKPNSVDARLDQLLPAALAALEDRQVQPVLVDRWRDGL